MLLNYNKNRHLSKDKLKYILTAFLFLAPQIVFFAVIRYIPLVQSITYSFYNYNFANPPGKPIGIEHYINTFKSEMFWLSMGNTLILFGLALILGFWVPIAQALFLNEIKRGKGLLRFLYILPAGIPGVASLAVWKYIWDPEAGLANAVTNFLGLGSHEWLYSPELVKICLRIPALLGGGLGMLLYLVAINNVPADLYEAAELDGASAFKRMIRVTLPNITHMIKIQLILALTGSLLAFEDVFFMTQGGPDFASTTVVLSLYQKAFNEQNFGQGMAISVIVFIITLTFTISQYKIMNRNNE